MVLAIVATGCASIGALAWPRTRHTYRYDREVAVEVRSEPDGAILVDDNGVQIGTAPFTYKTTHPVEYTRISRSDTGVLVGCVFDAVLAGTSMYLWFDRILSTGPDRNGMCPMGQVTCETDIFTSTRQKLAFAGYMVFATDGLTRGLITLFRQRAPGKGAALDAVQTVPVIYRNGERTEERTIPRTLGLTARWADWSPVKSLLDIPMHRLVVFRRGHAGTFDDAIVRQARSQIQLGPEGLYRAGLAYQRMAAETHDAEHARLARTYLEQYLATDAQDHRADAERLLGELRGAR